MGNLTKARGRTATVTNRGADNWTDVEGETVVIVNNSVGGVSRYVDGNGHALDGSRVREELGGLVDQGTFRQGFTVLLLVGGAWFGYRFLNASVEVLGIGALAFLGFKWLTSGKKG